MLVMIPAAMVLRAAETLLHVIPALVVFMIYAYVNLLVYGTIIPILVTMELPPHAVWTIVTYQTVGNTPINHALLTAVRGVRLVLIVMMMAGAMDIKLAIGQETTAQHAIHSLTALGIPLQTLVMILAAPTPVRTRRVLMPEIVPRASQCLVAHGTILAITEPPSHAELAIAPRKIAGDILPKRRAPLIPAVRGVRLVLVVMMMVIVMGT